MVDLFEKLKKEWHFQKPLTPQSQRESGKHCLPADPQDRKDGKILWTVGRHAGWNENLAGFQGPFLTSLQALTDTQESNSSCPWVWGVRKSYRGYRGPSQHCGCVASTCMRRNGRQGVNNKPQQHQPHIIPETNSSTRENIGALQNNSGTKSPEKNKDTSHKENSTR